MVLFTEKYNNIHWTVRTWGHSFKVRGESLKDKLFCTLRLTGAWNTLPRMVVEADMIVVLKRLSHRHMHTQGMDGKGAHVGKWDQFK